MTNQQKRFTIPHESMLAHTLLDIMIRASTNWDTDIDMTKLIIQTQSEYEMIKKYRELKGKNMISQNDESIERIVHVDYEVLGWHFQKSSLNST